MYKYIIKQIRRSAVSNALFCLLLALAGALLCISAGMWFSAHNALRNIDAAITTIAVPNQTTIARFAREQGIPPGEVLERIRNEIYPSGLLQMDERRVFNALAEGAEPLPLRMQGIGLEPELAANSPQAVAAFIVTCEIIETDHRYRYDESGLAYDIDGMWHYIGTPYGLTRSYNAVFTVNEVLRLHEAYREPRTIRIYHFPIKADGSPLFVRGGQYAVMGRYEQAGFGLSSLNIDIPWEETEMAVVDYAETNEEFNSVVNFHWGSTFFLEPDQLPAPIYERRMKRTPVPGEAGFYIFELEGGYEEAKISGLWDPISEALESIEFSSGSFQVLTTNDPNSLFRFNQRRNILEDGRLFSEAEVRDGARVCLVSARFAEHNGLKVGDVLPLELFNAVLGEATVTYMAGEDGSIATRSFWVPSRHHSDLEISGPIEYTIAGIYNTLTLDFGDYAIFPSTVVIPDRSFTGTLAGTPESMYAVPAHIPLLADGMIVPNGRVEEAIAVINGIAEGYGGLFRFYDQGYETLITSLRNMRWGMSWVLALAVSGWIVVAFVFAMFYVMRKRGDTAVLHSVGVSRGSRFGWVFIQCAVLILLAVGISLAAAMPLYGDIIDAAGGAAEEFTVSFRNLTLSDGAETGIRGRIPLGRSPFAMIVTAAGATALLLAAAGVMSARAAHFDSLDARRGGG
jgi:hypothetical protein